MILIVDDLPDGATALCKPLHHDGYRGGGASSGHEALTKIRSHPPEEALLVVMDDMMPDMNGMEVLHAIRAEPAIHATTLLFYTAGFDTAKRDEAMALGAVAWLFKGGDVEGTLRS